MKFCHLQINGWNWRTLSEARQVQKTKVHKFSFLCGIQAQNKCKQWREVSLIYQCFLEHKHIATKPNFYSSSVPFVSITVINIVPHKEAGK
jgi:hypothetical protein